MYFDFYDDRPDYLALNRDVARLEGLLHLIVAVSVAFFLDIVALIALVVLASMPASDGAKRAGVVPVKREPTRFVFMAPRVDRPSRTARPDAVASDQNRMAAARERSPNPTNPLPFSRGNTPERVEAQARLAARGEGPAPSPAPGQPAQSSSDTQSDAQSALQLPAKPAAPQSNVTGHAVGGGGALGEALRNLGRYVQHDQFDNPGGAGQPGAAIQFDTKGVEFGPWLRRFVAQIKRNWFIPYAAMSMKGHVVITFNVHKNGAITDLTVVGPCPVDAFNNAAFGALVSSNPTQPLPPEYPDEKAFFTVTFYYNEGQP